MDSANSALSYHQQQVIGYKSKKHKEVLYTSITSLDKHTSTLEDSYVNIQEITSPETIGEKNEEGIKDERIEWKRKQEECKKCLKENKIEPLKLKVYDFTKQSENQKRLKNNNFEFIGEDIIQEPDYMQEDINILYSTIGLSITPIISKDVTVNTKSHTNEEEASGDRNGVQEASQLMRSGQIIRGDFMCFRNMTRDIIGLTGILVLLVAIVGLLFMIFAV